MVELLAGLALLIVLVAVLLVALDRLAPGLATRAGLGLERLRAGLKPASIKVDGATVTYLHGGSGDEVLLLVHGFGADKDNFVRVTPHLKRRFRVISVDLPGFGESTRLHDADYTFAAQATRLHGIARALGLERFHLGGSSMGGAIALRYGLKYPDDVRSLWLLAPAGVGDSDDSPMAAEYRANGNCLLVASSVDDYNRLMALVMEKQPFIPGSVRRTLAARAIADRELHLRVFDTIANEPPLNEDVQELKVPALIVWGTLDRVLDASGAPILHDRLPVSTLHLLDGIGHLPLIEVPKRTARDFIAFVDALPGAG